MTRALSIYLPHWPIWVATATGPARRPGRPAERPHRLERKPPEPPAVLLCTAERGVRYVSHGCRRAEAAGVRAGITLAHARSLLAGLPVREIPHAPERDAAALRALARWMLCFAPVVAPDDPDGLLLDLTGCRRLFGGEPRHVERIGEALGRWGLSARMAAAPTFACARAVARHGAEAITLVPPDGVRAVLAPLPVRALRIDADALEALTDVGVECLGHLFDLPREALAARFGPALLQRLDEAAGSAAETLRPVQALRRFEASRAFDGPIRRWEIVSAVTRQLLAELLSQLRSLERGILVLAVRLRRVDLAAETMSLRLTHPTRDERHLWDLLRPRLERAHLGYGVEEIVVRAARTARLPAEQAAFLSDPRHDASAADRALGELVDRLTDRLGDRAVTRARLAETYVPEQAFVHAPVGTLTSGRGPRRDARLYPAHRPSQLFDAPEPARVLSLVPDGPPAWIEWRGVRATVHSSAGPERIAFPWWTRGTAAGRDYYEVDDDLGRRLWVYRDHDSGRWFVHGQWM